MIPPGSMPHPTGRDRPATARVDIRSRLAAIVDSSDDAIISKDLDGVISTWNQAAQQLFGYSEAEAVGQSIALIIPAELRDEEIEILRRIRRGDRIDHYETRRVTRDGRILEVSITISPVRDADGRVVGASKVLRDITGSKRAEFELRMMHQRLIDAQEDERRRIARELHDDIGQRLAVLSLELEALAGRAAAAAPDHRQQIDRTREQLRDLTRDVQALSHRLHPARLEYLSIEGAVAALCRELSELRGVEIVFTAEGVPREVPRRVALCLYRVLQEALQNALKYSGAPRIDVSLRGGAGAIELTVHDRGEGFELSTTGARGLGLTSMNERVRAVRGRLAILSAPHHGTTIRASVPAAGH